MSPISKSQLPKRSLHQTQTIYSHISGISRIVPKYIDGQGGHGQCGEEWSWKHLKGNEVVRGGILHLKREKEWLDRRWFEGFASGLLGTP
ncbi:predicted protein [Sclerotinia sclerotiorum 1980 UF-70]|uniref:Uncharacterized protein n=1 Tax=Sclerotinia sclerotiorum (strain ATCC 18683 / 1980 / Ss-1) TaxID=665079 RepID=A7EM33_SCLS1|nr:predicted protein [Sclerotinia sclerotiorum 1980 UF-70]EDO03899.1 predicted protein [Sclerotinia sclerotiorum 1980 UF-70]